MKTVVQMALGITFVLVASLALADDKKEDYAKLAVGSWEVTITHAGGPPKGGTVEFTKDGKLKVTGEHNIEGTYKIEGKRMKLKVKVENDEHNIDLTIDKLDDKTFAMNNEAGKVELTRKK
ncbi:MAG: TIGR03066 family protein [Gemmatales bacterium]